MAVMLVLIGCKTENLPTQPKIVTSTPTYTPAPQDKSTYRPLPINYNWKEGVSGTTMNIEGFGAPSLSDSYLVSNDTTFILFFFKISPQLL